MDFIRRQKSTSNYYPNTQYALAIITIAHAHFHRSHCIYGADADLIMLGLATHEPHFWILREDFSMSDRREVCALCNQPGHSAPDCKGLAREKSGPHDDVMRQAPQEKHFLFLHLPILREYLRRELDIQQGLRFPYDFERCIDDWIFMNFFVGNDFLPHLPSLEIREGAVDRLVSVYCETMKHVDGYLTENGRVCIHRLAPLLRSLGEQEDAIFRERRSDDMRRRENDRRRKERDRDRQMRGGYSNVPVVRPPTGVAEGLSTHGYAVVAASAEARDLSSRVPAQARPPPQLPTPGTLEASPFLVALPETGPLPAKGTAVPNDLNRDAAARLKSLLKGGGEPASEPSGSSGAPSVDEQASAETQPSRRRNREDEQDDLGETDGSTKAKMAISGEQELQPPGANDAEADSSKAEEEKEDVESQESAPIPGLTLVSSSVSHPPARRCRTSPLVSPETLTADSPETASPSASKVNNTDEAPITAHATDAAASVVPAVAVNDAAETDGPEDNIRLGEEGWRERYYEAKFHVTGEDRTRVLEVAREYVTGMCWVLLYYYQGCPSWTWYFPDHYAPFASDLADVVATMEEVVFPNDTQPFRPLEQLMGVLPAASGALLPEKWRQLMVDEDSPIIDFYPEQFDIDMNGKKQEWQGVALLPFIEEHRLLEALKSVYGTLTAEESRRNGRRVDRLFLSSRNMLCSVLERLYRDGFSAVSGAGTSCQVLNVTHAWVWCRMVTSWTLSNHVGCLEKCFRSHNRIFRARPTCRLWKMWDYHTSAACRACRTLQLRMCGCFVW
jgi:5'-3' exoribonuclease 2